MLVHGAWHGGWCWEHLGRRLDALGHTVLCPDLPGHGLDPTPPGRVTMKSCVDSVAGVLGALQERAVVVGHSFGGAVVSQVCEQDPGSVNLAVYLSAFLLRDGESVWRHDSPAPDAMTSASVLSTPNLRLDEQERTLDVDRAVIPEGFYAGCSPQDIAGAVARWRPQPLAPLLTPLSLTQRRFGKVPRAYISCRDDHVIPFEAQEHMCRLTPCEVNLTMDSGHSPFLSHPEALAGLLGALQPEARAEQAYR